MRALYRLLPFKLRLLLTACTLAVGLGNANLPPFAGWSAIAHSAAAQSFDGRVVAVLDGDTVDVLTPSRQSVRIRLAEIDAPEKKMAFGQRSKQSLSDLCYQKNVRVDIIDTDRYQRTVGRLWCDGVNANVEQLRRGMAMVYVAYAKDPSLFTVEREARSARRGLWADAAPTPPWEWRQANR